MVWVNLRSAVQRGLVGALGVYLVPALLSACGGSLDFLNPDRHREVRGVIGPSVGGGEACVGLMGDDGAWYDTHWPEGWQVEPAPARIVGPDGRTFTEAGDTVVVVGQLTDERQGACPGTPLAVESARRAGQ